MIGVRFPNGVLVQYEEAEFYMDRYDERFVLRDGDGRDIALVPKDCIIEHAVLDDATNTKWLPRAAVIVPNEKI